MAEERTVEAASYDSAGSEVATDFAWTSSDTGVVAVAARDTAGTSRTRATLTARDTGEAAVVVSSENGVGDTVSVAVRQLTARLHVKDVDVRPRSVLVGQEDTVDVVLAPTNGQVGTVAWTVRDSGEAVADGRIEVGATSATDTLRLPVPAFPGPGWHDLSATLTHVSGPEDVELGTLTTPDSIPTLLRVRERGFAIRLRFTDNFTEEQKKALRRARDRLESTLTGDLPDVPTANLESDLIYCMREENRPAGGLQTTRDTVDDIVIFVHKDTLSSAAATGGPCLMRGSDYDLQPPLPIYGSTRFDKEIWGDEGNTAALEEVGLHEMLHAVGFGIQWEYQGIDGVGPFRRLIEGDRGGGTGRFVGPSAIRQHLARGGPLWRGGIRLAERGSHWSYDAMPNSIMTPSTGNDDRYPAITVGTLADMYLSVDYSAADDYDPWQNASSKAVFSARGYGEGELTVGNDVRTPSVVPIVEPASGRVLRRIDRPRRLRPEERR